MNQPTITGSTDSNGLFTAKNPIPFFGGDKETFAEQSDRIQKWNDFNEQHPPLFCYNENNQLVKGVEGLEVKGPVKAYRPYRGNNKFDVVDNINDVPGLIANGWKVFECYIALQPTEKSEIKP